MFDIQIKQSKNKDNDISYVQNIVPVTINFCIHLYNNEKLINFVSIHFKKLLFILK